MANRISDRMVKAFERFNADLKAFGEETGETFVTLYEDAFTTRRVRFRTKKMRRTNHETETDAWETTMEAKPIQKYSLRGRTDNE